MKFVTIIVTRSKSCHVKTLHSVLKFNIICIKTGNQNQIAFVKDDPFDKIEIVQKFVKSGDYDRVLFIDFGVSVDEESLKQATLPHEGVGCLVYPGVCEGIDWDMFKRKVREEEIPEPVSQCGLEFDTEVSKKISNDIYVVTSTNARAWVMMCKNIIKQAKCKKTGNFKLHTKMFEKLKEQGVRIYAYTASKLVLTYTHECISSILSAAGVKAV